MASTFLQGLENVFTKKSIKSIGYQYRKGWPLFCTLPDITMLSRRDILIELKRMGVTKPSLLKDYLRDFEKYIGTYYDFTISKVKKKLNHKLDQDTVSPSEKLSAPAVTQRTRNIE